MQESLVDVTSHFEYLMTEKEKRDKEKEEFEFVVKQTELKKVAVTSFFDTVQLEYLDLLGARLDLSRSALQKELVIPAMFDVIEKLHLTEEFEEKLEEIYERMNNGDLDQEGE